MEAGGIEWCQHGGAVGLIGAGIGPVASAPRCTSGRPTGRGCATCTGCSTSTSSASTPSDVGDLVRAAQRAWASTGSTSPTRASSGHRAPRRAVAPGDAALGAVNTVVFETAGDRPQHRRDRFRRVLRPRSAGRAADRVVQLGAGGAGARSRHAILALGAGRLTVVDALPDRAARRRPDRALGAGRAASHARIPRGSSPTARRPRPRHPHRHGRHPGLPFPAGAAAPRLWVAEVVYRPLETELLRAAAAPRAAPRSTAADGRLSRPPTRSALFTGREPDSDRMLAHVASSSRRLHRHRRLSGTLAEKLAAAAAAGFDAVEIFENDLIASPLTPEEIRAPLRRLGLTIDLFQPMRDIEAVPEDEFARNLRRAGHKFALMAAARRGHRPGLLERLAARRRRRRARRRAAARPGGPRGARRDPGRLRGARVGAPREHVRPRLAHRRGRRPSRPRHLSRQLPHPVPRLRPERDRGHPRREDLLPPARRRPAAGHGRAAVEPPPPLLPGPGRLRRRGLSRPRPARGYDGPALARGVQRRLPPGRPGPHCGRRPALAVAARGRAPAGRGAARLRVRRAGGRAGAGGGPRAAADRDGLPPRRAAPLQAGAAVAPRRDTRPRQPRAAVRGAADRRDRGRERRPDPLRPARQGAARAEPAAHPAPARPTSPRSPRPTAPPCSSAGPRTGRATS